MIILIHCKDTVPKTAKNIHRTATARPPSQFLHSYICEQFIYSHDRSANLAAAKWVDRFWDHINRSQMYEYGNWEQGRAV